VGIFKHLLFWPVTGPLWMARFSLEQVDGAARRELTDDAPVKEDLLELQLLLELGEIDEEEYLAREAALMARLRETRRRREELGMQAPWRPLGGGKGERGEADDGEGASSG
jgi:hypothetical protein